MNIAVAQSGGPTCAINASLLGVFRHATKSDQIQTVYGSVNGIEGLIYDNLVNLNEIITDDEEVELIRQTPSTVLGSCRHKLRDPSVDDSEYKKIAATLLSHDIGAFFYIGGNDSMDTVVKLNAYFTAHGIDVKVMGIPKTIDNDLPITDHTPGFGSAAKYVATTMQEIVRDSSVYSIESVTIVEIMGRDTGWLTASSSILRANGLDAPHLIYLPEIPFSVSKFLDDVREQMKKHYAVVVAVSEGIEIPPEEAISEQSGDVDAFGHKYLAGVGKTLEKIVKHELKCKVRSIELNVMQRCSSHLSSKRDITEAERIGGAAVSAVLEGGVSGQTMVFHRISNHPYNVRIEHVDAKLVANRVKYFPKEWISESGNDVTAEALEYFLPLIQGEQNFHMQNGMPRHFILKKALPQQRDFQK